MAVKSPEKSALPLMSAIKKVTYQMTNPNQFIKNQQFCIKLSENARKLEEQKGGVIQEIHQQRERVGTRKGEISIAEDRLLSLVNRAQDIVTDSVNLVGNTVTRNSRGAAQDIAKLAISLSNDQAKQNIEITRLQRLLRNDEALLRAKQNQQAGIQSQIDEIIGLMRINNC